MSLPRLPPRWARRLVELMLDGSEREFILGDLAEMFARRRTQVGLGAATVSYLMWGLRSSFGQLRGDVASGWSGDVRMALRQFRRYPRVYLGGTVVLALGLGVATFSWGIYYGGYRRGLPVAASERMFDLVLQDRETHALSFGLSVRDVERLSSSVADLELVGLWGSGSVHLNDGQGPPEKISTLQVSPVMFDLLEIVPLHGRVLVADDAREGSAAVVVLGHDLWMRRYQGSSALVGSQIRIDGRPTTVVGVLPPGARFVGADPLWVPVGTKVDPDARAYTALARVRPGVDAAALDSRLNSEARRLEDQGVDDWMGVSALAVRFGTSLGGPNASVGTRVMSSAGILLLLMALANVANLFLVRTQARTRELGVRRALGAGRARIMRQIALEASLPALLSFLGGALIAGGGLAQYRAAAFVYGGGTPGPIWVWYGLETPHLIVLALGAVLSTVFVSVVTGFRELSRDGAESLRAGRGTTAGRFRAGRIFLGVEVAVGCTLLLLSSLLIRSYWNLKTVDYGFATESVMSGEVELEATAYASPEERLRFFAQLEEGLEALPGVRWVALGTQLPMIRYRGDARVEVEGWEAADASDVPVHRRAAVSDDYFDTFDTPLLAGRPFSSADGPESQPVALVNESFTRRYFPGEVPIGRRVRVWNGSEPGPWRTVVGVAPHLWMDSDVDRFPEGIYVPLRQMAPGWNQFGVRVQGPPSTYAGPIRELVAGLDPELPVLQLQTMPELIRMRTRFYRYQSPPFIAVGIIALFLAVGGLYAVVSYLASLRSAEFGVRAALGARRAELVGRSIGAVWLPTTAGLVVGVVLGRLLTTGFDRWVFQVDPSSGWVTVASVLVFAVTAGGASLLPALRASRVDLVDLMRAE